MSAWFPLKHEILFNHHIREKKQNKKERNKYGVFGRVQTNVIYLGLLTIGLVKENQHNLNCV